jgi:hypothetical protein
LRTSVASVLLLKRVFDLDLAHCPNCGDELKIIAAVLEQPAIKKVLARLGFAGACAAAGASPSPRTGAASGLTVPRSIAFHVTRRLGHA